MGGLYHMQIVSQKHIIKRNSREEASMRPLEFGSLNVANGIRVRAPSSPPHDSILEFGGNKFVKLDFKASN